jgi:hypothetical protein
VIEIVSFPHSSTTERCTLWDEARWHLSNAVICDIADGFGDDVDVALLLHFLESFDPLHARMESKVTVEMPSFRTNRVC